MKPRTLIPLVIGLGIGVFAIKMGVDMLRKAGAAQGESVNVLMSAKSIDVATNVTEPMLSTKEVPRTLVPRDAFTDRKALLGRVTAMSISAGVPITAAMLAPVGAEPGLRAKIPAGFRAVSISVTEESAVAGFVMPGARVDVFEGDDQTCSRSKLLISDVEVGAAGQSMNDVDKDGKTVRITKSVTLFLRPDQVELLPAGKKNLRLALRGTVTEPQAQNGPGLAALFGKALEAKAEPPKPKKSKRHRTKAAPQQRVLEVVRGVQVEQLVFTATDTPGEYRLVPPTDAHPEASAKRPRSAKSSTREIRE